jgi:ubiquinone/menaquinone biosynthesis C-methylase UbiE
VVVDVGCGTGGLTRVLASGLKKEKGGKVIGLDRNPELLRVARRISKEKGLSGIMAFKRGDAKAISLPDGFADRVVCQADLLTGVKKQ